MQHEQILAFRLARSGLADRAARGLAEAAACPASDFSRDAALLALAARLDGLTRDRYDEAVDGGDLVVAHIVRGAIHALAPQDLALYGRRLISGNEHELGQQLGQQVQRLAAEKGFAPTEALQEVAEATKDVLGGGRALDKNELHAELRERVRADLMPWCKGCGSHHVAPMLWRYGSVKAGTRLDSRRRYVLGRPGGAPAATEAVRRFLHFYGPATSGDFAEWAGLAKPHAQRLWTDCSDIEGDLEEVSVGTRTVWVLRDDAAALASPPAAAGIRLIPPGDPYLQKPTARSSPPRPSCASGWRRRSASPTCAVPPRRSWSSSERAKSAWPVRGRQRYGAATRLLRMVVSDVPSADRRQTGG